MTDPAYSCARDYQLFGPGPKRILSLDGGGVRGSITVAFLERIEALLSAHSGRPVRLGELGWDNEGVGCVRKGNGN